MTKCVILGEGDSPKKVVKPIVFKEVMTNSKVFGPTRLEPSDWKNIELIVRGYGLMHMDVMFAYNNVREDGNLYLGEWNTGLVCVE